MIQQQTQSQYTRIDVNLSDLAGGFDTDSNLTVIGSDGTEALNVQDGAIYYENRHQQGISIIQ